MLANCRRIFTQPRITNPAPKAIPISRVSTAPLSPAPACTLSMAAMLRKKRKAPAIKAGALRRAPAFRTRNLAGSVVAGWAKGCATHSLTASRAAGSKSYSWLGAASLGLSDYRRPDIAAASFARRNLSRGDLTRSPALHPTRPSASGFGHSMRKTWSRLVLVRARDVRMALIEP